MSGSPQKPIIRKLWAVARKCGLGPVILYLYPKSALAEDGWFKSYRRGIPIDAAGNPLPWLTYPAIEFLKSRLNEDLTLFEYGCGFSTKWYCTKVKEVTSVENNREWAERVQESLPKNGKVLFKEDQNEFVKAIEQAGRVDVIVVDGMAREECYRRATSFLTPRGIIIADNSEREDFADSWPKLQEDGFKKITFTGITPSHFVKSQTSILYRPGNCLNI
jgi:precorrin-6B methylase 2